MSDGDLAWLDATLDTPHCECTCVECHGSRLATAVVRIHDCERTPPVRVMLACEPCQRTYLRQLACQIQAATANGQVYACPGCRRHFHSIADVVVEVLPL